MRGPPAGEGLTQQLEIVRKGLFPRFRLLIRAREIGQDNMFGVSVPSQHCADAVVAAIADCQ